MAYHNQSLDTAAIGDVLNAFPDPLFVKNAQLQYAWANTAFCRLFCLQLTDVVNQIDTELFANRQAVQCNGGDLRVLDTGEPDEAPEVVLSPAYGRRDVVTRKVRTVLGDDRKYLIGIMHDVSHDRVADADYLDAYKSFLRHVNKVMVSLTEADKQSSFYAHSLDRLVNDQHFVTRPEIEMA